MAQGGSGPEVPGLGDGEADQLLRSLVSDLGRALQGLAVGRPEERHSVAVLRGELESLLGRMEAHRRQLQELLDTLRDDAEDASGQRQFCQAVLSCLQQGAWLDPDLCRLLLEHVFQQEARLQECRRCLQVALRCVSENETRISVVRVTLDRLGEPGQDEATQQGQAQGDQNPVCREQGHVETNPRKRHGSGSARPADSAGAKKRKVESEIGDAKKRKTISKKGELK